jgi:hypothetical protein
MSPEIDFHHISLLEDHLVAGIGCIVSSAVIDAQTTRETHSSLDVVSFLQTLMTSQGTDCILDALSDFCQVLTRLDILLGILTDLAVNLGALAVFLQEVVVHAVQVALLLVRGAVSVVVLVFDDLALGVLAVREKVRDWNAWRRALLFRTALLLL